MKMGEHKHSYTGATWTTSTIAGHTISSMCAECGQVLITDEGNHVFLGLNCTLCGYSDQCFHDDMEISQVTINSEFCHVLNCCKKCGHTQEVTKPTKHDWEDGECRLCKRKYQLVKVLINDFVPFSTERSESVGNLKEKMENSVSCANVTPGATCSPCILKVHKDCGETDKSNKSLHGKSMVCFHETMKGKWVQKDEMQCSYISTCCDCHAYSQTNKTSDHIYQQEGICVACAYKPPCLHVFVAEKTNSGLWYLPSVCIITSKCQLCGQVQSKTSQHIHGKNTECILCKTKRPCNHVFVYQQGPNGFPNISSDSWSCKRVEACSWCGEIKQEDSNHNWIHKPTSETLPNVAVCSEYVDERCRRLLECSLCGDKIYTKRKHHKMFCQACRHCGFQEKECVPCDNCRSHIVVGSFASLHMMNEKGECLRCHITCRHDKTTYVEKHESIIIDEFQCASFEICNNCGVRVTKSTQPHVWADHKCKDCGYQRSEKQQKRQRFIELVDYAKKQCLEIVGNKFDTLKTDGLAAMDV